MAFISTSLFSSAEDGRALYRTYLYMLRRRADASDKDFKKMAEIFEEGATVCSFLYPVHTCGRYHLGYFSH